MQIYLAAADGSSTRAVHERSGAFGLLGRHGRCCCAPTVAHASEDSGDLLVVELTAEGVRAESGRIAFDKRTSETTIQELTDRVV